MKYDTLTSIFVLITAAGVLAADDIPDKVEYEWINIPSRRDVSDILKSDNGYYVTYRGGGAAFYDIAEKTYRLYGLKDGLTHLYVNSVIEDDDYLYFGTRNGLTKIDMVTGEYDRVIRMWGNAYNDCTGLAVTDRYLYVSTTEGARRFDQQFGPPVEILELKQGERPLSKQIDDGWEVYYNPDGVVTEDLYSVLVGDEGTAYWGGYNRIPVQYPDDSWSVIELDVEVGNITRIRYLGERLAIFGPGGGYYCDTETGHCEPIIPELEGVPLNGAVISGDYIYLGGPAGLYIAKTDGKKFKLSFGTPAESIGEKKKNKKSALWLISEDIGKAGVNRIVAINNILVLGTTDGVYHCGPGKKEFSRPDIPLGLSGPAVYSILQDGDTLYAIGSGGVDRIEFGDTGPAPVISTSFPSSETFRDVTVIGGGIVTLSGDGLFNLENTGFVPVYGFSDEGIYGTGQCLRVFDSRLGTDIYIGTSRSLFALNADFSIEDGFHGLNERDIVGLAAIGNVLYAATRYDGVYGLTPGYGDESRSHIDGDTGLSGEEIISLNTDGERLFVGYFDKGLDILTPELELIENITWGDGLSHTDIFAVAYDPPYIWISVRGVGINAYNPETRAREDIRKYFARYGLGDEYCRDIEVLGPGSGYDHRVVFATASGVSILCYDGDIPPDLSVGDKDRGYR